MHLDVSVVLVAGEREVAAGEYSRHGGRKHLSAFERFQSETTAGQTTVRAWAEFHSRSILGSFRIAIEMRLDKLEAIQSAGGVNWARCEMCKNFAGRADCSAFHLNSEDLTPC